MFHGLCVAAGAAASLIVVAGTTVAQEEPAPNGGTFERQILLYDSVDRGPSLNRPFVVYAPPEGHEDLELALAVQADGVAGETAAEIADASGLWLGVQLAQEIPAALSHHLGDKKGALVENVYPDSPAAETGFEAYDLIVKVGDQPIDSHEALVQAMKSVEARPVDVVVLRGGEQKTISVTPRERAAPEATTQVNDLFFYTVPQMRVLPALQGQDAQVVRHRIVNSLEAKSPLPENIESLKIVWERNGDKVEPKYEIATTDGKVFKATNEEEVNALPVEVRKAIPLPPHHARFAIRLDAAPQGVVPGLAAVPGHPPVAGAPVFVPPPVVAQPRTTVTQQAMPAWVDVFRTAPDPQAHVFMNRAAEPSPQLDELKAEMQKLNGALERIEKLLQKE